MDSDKVELTDSVKEILRQLRPEEQMLVFGVLLLLGDDLTRDTQKFNLFMPAEDGRPTWGFADGRVWAAFVEEESGKITVVHASIQSRFRPPLRGDYGFGI